MIEQNRLPRVISTEVQVDHISDFKTEFLKITEGYLGKPLTMANLESLHSDINRLLNYYRLGEIKFRLISRDNEIKISPIREIDKYALKGLLE